MIFVVVTNIAFILPENNAWATVASTEVTITTQQLEEATTTTQQFKFGEFIVYSYIGLSTLAGIKGVYDTAQRKKKNEEEEEQ